MNIEKCVLQTALLSSCLLCFALSPGYPAGATEALLNGDANAVETAGASESDTADQKSGDLRSTSGLKAAREAGCVRNFRSEGGFFKGRKYTTSVDMGRAPLDEVITRMARKVAKLGYENVDVDRATGLITARVGVSFGEGKTVPLNISVEETGTKELVAHFVVNLSGGLVASKKEARQEFCKIAGAALAGR